MNNPITNAAHAAWAELTTDDAYSYYERTAWYCAQRAVDDSIITITYAVYAIYSLGSLAYDCGALFRSQVEAGLHDGDALALPAAPVCAALPAVSSAPAYVRRRRNRVAPVTRNAPIPAMPVRDYSAPRFYVAVAPIPVAKCKGGERKAQGFAMA